ncbi:MAG: adenosylcobinamide-phosphate synthase CbiB [Pseudomonadota bacterium]
MVALSFDPAPGLMLAAFAIEGAWGWPKPLYNVVRHPVVWIGALCDAGTGLLNRGSWSHTQRYLSGVLTTLVIVVLTFISARLMTSVLPETTAGFIGEAIIASSLLASRSLYTHVKAVLIPLSANNLDNARSAVSQIVGRDPAALDEAGVTRAAIESLAENTSDGVVAPLFWGVLLGLPGMAAYKAINTLDSMIGHRNKDFSAFGGFAARIDDVANFIPSRMTGLLFVLASARKAAWHTMIRDAARHRSPNAGWPEAAMAGALGVRLSGPRHYGNAVSKDPWLNEAAPNPTDDTIRRALFIYQRALALCLLFLVLVTLGMVFGR